MEYTEFSSIFLQAARQNGIAAPNKAQIQQFYQFHNHLFEVNQTINLTAIRNPNDAIYKHYIDSLLALEHIPQGARVLDLGCGPGFPSIPLAIARPDLSIVALDSTAKKIAFVSRSAEILGLTYLTAIAGRAEDTATAKALGGFDIVISRAVARMNVLTELCLPYVRIGGIFIALKGAKADEEVLEARAAIAKLGGSAPKSFVQPLILQDSTAEARSTVVIRKQTATPKGFPRSYAAILKKPL